jgi:hypothetical protein
VRNLFTLRGWTNCESKTAMSDPDFWLAVGIMGRVHYGSTDKQRVVDHIATLSLYNDINLALVPVWKNANPLA